MTDINIDDFFKDGAKVLSQLYTVFPRRHSIFVENICGAEEPDEFGLHGARHMSCFGTLLWLGEEGFLRYEDVIRQEAIDQAVLSARCFTVLSRPSLEAIDSTDTDQLPGSIRAERATSIHRIRQALKQKSSAQIRSVMVDLLEQMNA
jgi:hypothetical protein